MEVDVVPAAEGDIGIVSNLFVLYAHDLCEQTGADVTEEGRFALPVTLSEYWHRSSNSPWPPDWRGFPFLLRVADRLAGFALVRQISADTYDMGEFFVVRKYRRQGVGRRAATAVFDRFSGNWEVRQMLTNLPAQSFWRRVIADYTAGRFSETQEFFERYQRAFVVQRFRMVSD